MSAEHGYDVIPVISQDPRNPLASIMRYRADCTCDESFGLRDEQKEAALDGLDHVRKRRGAPTRRGEIAVEQARAKVRR